VRPVVPEPGLEPPLAAAGATSEPLDDIGPATPSSRRVLGLDVARAVAILGMLLAHYPILDGTGGPLRGIARFVDGKAMPLFLLLAGCGVTLLVRRHPHPARALLGRAGVLLVVGLVLHEHIPHIAVVLHFYAAYLVAALLVHRLPSGWLLAVAGAVTVAGALTWLHLTPDLAPYGGWQGWATLRDPVPLVNHLLVTGTYPVLPSFAFVAVGMVVARADLTSPLARRRLLAGGAALAVLGYGVGGLLSRAVGDDGRIADGRPTASALAELDRAFGLSGAEVESRIEAAAARTGSSLHRATDDLVRSLERATGDVRAERLLDPVGHGNMPAWVLGATGTSLMAVAVSLAASRRWPRATHPLSMAGQCALSFYVGHAVVLRWWWHPDVQPALGYTAELAWSVVVFAVFVGGATLWRHWFARGPLEALLRLAGGPSRF
jgi:uncharacterized membrane protein